MSFLFSFLKKRQTVNNQRCIILYVDLRFVWSGGNMKIFDSLQHLHLGMKLTASFFCGGSKSEPILSSGRCVHSQNLTTFDDRLILGLNGVIYSRMYTSCQVHWSCSTRARQLNNSLRIAIGDGLNQN